MIHFPALVIFKKHVRSQPQRRDQVLNYSHTVVLRPNSSLNGKASVQTTPELLTCYHSDKKRATSELRLFSVGFLSLACFSDIMLAAVSACVIHYFSYLLCSNSPCPVNISLEYWKFLPFKLEHIYGGPYMSLILHPFNGIS